MGFKKTLVSIVLGGAIALGIYGSVSGQNTPPEKQTREPATQKDLVEILDKNYEFKMVVDNLKDLGDIAINPANNHLFYVIHSEDHAEGIYELVNGKSEKKFPIRIPTLDKKREDITWSTPKIDITSNSKLVLCQAGSIYPKENKLPVRIIVFDLNTGEWEIAITTETSRGWGRYKSGSTAINPSDNNFYFGSTAINPSDNNFYFGVSQNLHCLEMKSKDLNTWKNVKEPKETGLIPIYNGFCFGSNNDLYEIWDDHITKIQLPEQEAKEIELKPGLSDSFKPAITSIIYSFRMENARIAPNDNRMIIVGTLNTLGSSTHILPPMPGMPGEEPTKEPGDYVIKVDLGSGNVAHIARAESSNILRGSGKPGYSIAASDVDSKGNIYLSLKQVGPPVRGLEGKIVQLTGKE